LTVSIVIGIVKGHWWSLKQLAVARAPKGRVIKFVIRIGYRLIGYDYYSQIKYEHLSIRI